MHKLWPEAIGLDEIVRHSQFQSQDIQSYTHLRKSGLGHKGQPKRGKKGRKERQRRKILDGLL